MIYCIVPFSRTSFSDNVWDNFINQTYTEKQLIIVQNNGAKWEKRKEEIILDSDKGVSQPMNVGLEWIRQNGNKSDFFCKYDDDDKYLPNYLNTIQEGINKGAEIIGKNSCWVKNTKEKLWYVKGNQNNWCDGEYCHGPTLAGKIDISPDFPIVDKFGEDQLWCDLTRNRKQWIGSARDFIYCRYNNHNHAYPFSDESMKHIYAGSLYEVIKGSPENDYPEEMKLIQQKLYSADFDRMIEEITR